MSENINLIKSRVTVGGIICSGGEIWRVLGKVRGRTYEDVETQIRKNFESWEMALLTLSSFIFFVIVLSTICGICKYRSGNYTTGEYLRRANRRHSNVRSYAGSEASDHKNHHRRHHHKSGAGSKSGPHSAKESRKIEMKSEDHFEDDDSLVLGGQTQPAYSDSGSERVLSPPERRY